MPKWTNEKRAVARQETILALTREGGRIAKGKHTGQWFVENVPTFASSRNNIGQILKLLDRDGYIVIERTESGYIKAVALPPQSNGVEPEKETVTRDDEKMEAASLPGPKVVAPPPVEGIPLANLEARVILMEERARLVITEAETAMNVIAFLKDTPPEFDATGPIRAERDYLQKQVHELQRKLKDREREASDATNRLAGTQVRLTAEKERGDALEKNMRAMLNNRTKSGITIREALEPRASNEIERLMRNTPTRKG